MIRLFSKSKKKNRDIVICTIHDASVIFLGMRFLPGDSSDDLGRGSVFVVHTEPYPQAFSADIPAPEKVLHNVLRRGWRRFESRLPRHIWDQVIIVLGAPWIETRIEQVTLDFEKPLSIRTHHLEQLTKSLRITSERHIAKTYQSKIDFVTTEVHRLNVFLDSFLVENPIGKKGSHLGVQGMVSMIPKDLFALLVQFGQSIVPDAPVVFRSFMSGFVLSDALLFKAIDRLAYISIGRCMSEYMILEHGHVKKVASYPFGTASYRPLLPGAVQESRTLEEQFFMMLGNGSLDPAYEARLLKKMKHISHDWRNSLIHFLSDTVRSGYRFDAVCIATSEPHHAFFEQQIMNECQDIFMAHHCPLALAPRHVIMNQETITFPKDTRPTFIEIISTLTAFVALTSLPDAYVRK
jgi:hypothetical protein